MNRYALATMLAASLSANAALADDTGSTAGAAAAGTEVSEPNTPATEAPVRAYSRRVYNVDDVGMIIGGASEDAKAKVGRLPVQK